MNGTRNPSGFALATSERERDSENQSPTHSRILHSMTSFDLFAAETIVQTYDPSNARNARVFATANDLQV